MDSPLAVGREVIVRPRTRGLASHYTDARGTIVEVREDARIYVVSFGDPEAFDEIRLVLTEEEVDPI